MWEGDLRLIHIPIELYTESVMMKVEKMLDSTDIRFSLNTAVYQSHFWRTLNNVRMFVFMTVNIRFARRIQILHYNRINFKTQPHYSYLNEV